MIFKTLTLNNFRVFNGETTIELTPRKQGVFERPIILFGGLNGAGKTSILTAIRLALLGRRALGAVITNKDYLAYLNEQTNNTALKLDPSTEASITLSFKHTHQGEHKLYEVTRAWQAEGEEQLILKVNSVEDTALTNEQVQAFLHELVPPGIGDLFFFDGEKIAELAEDDTGSYLKEAVQKLLGIDIINRLNTDLDIYLKGLGTESADKDTLKKIQAAEDEKRTITKEVEVTRVKIDEIGNILTDIKRKIAVKEADIQAHGGAWAETKEQEQAKINDLYELEKDLNTKIRHELSGCLPMALAPTAMQGLIDQLAEDQKIKQAKAFGNELSQALPALQDQISKSFNAQSGDIMATINSYFGQLTAEYGMASPELDISDSEFALIKAQLEEGKQSQCLLKELSTTLEQVQHKLSSLSVNIERAPDAADLKDLYENLRALEKECDAVSKDYINALLKAKTLKTKELELAKRLEKLYAKLKNNHSADKAVHRVQQSQYVLDDFKTALTELRVTQLEELFVTAYRKLARKEDLKLSAKIDPQSFDVNLVDAQGAVINRKSMSAGEKQIFAFAILEALGKLSGKVLPVVVDTPLGRLDSKHRDKLIKHYFPEASEQVILLSTDTEVDQDFYQAIEHKVSHAFEIEFNQTTNCSTLREGYFWAELSKEAV
ncbi:DNA sulfur modification protein DndD [Pseudoalteromonas sp. S4498]|uniref:DNA sulfur modification protein DndD n=1 Tax=Pseudoalteromonas galatheae TaxID=579562 RepID=UPI001108FE26|nr:DNA sulfur modification protein DndD [Pseudoalteromonas galatheae]NKC21477.1 DNA sulfur modification protein DndD [Pseudoalteromonas galatheae]